MKLSCAIIDDEPLAVELMESYVRKTPFLELQGSFGSGVAASACCATVRSICFSAIFRCRG